MKNWSPKVFGTDNAALAPISAKYQVDFFKNQEINEWIGQYAELAQPDNIELFIGTPEQKKALTEQSYADEELIELDQEKWPGCSYHRSDPGDVARMTDKTFICTESKEDAGPLNNHKPPRQAYQLANNIIRGSMKGRTLYAVPFSMGPTGSELSKLGIELSDSRYVSLNMQIMTRMAQKVIGLLDQGADYVMCLHGKAELDVNKRYIFHFPQDNLIYSVGSGYGGNALLGKKCLALRIGSTLGQKDKWMAEHMLILEVTLPDGRKINIAAAFPSGCGKTNLAMVKPPKPFEEAGYKVKTIGDDIAWLRPDAEGNLVAINPENGFFGVAPGTSWETNPNMMHTISTNTIFTNVLLFKNENDKWDIWWEGKGDEPPAEGIAWDGKPWKPGMKDGKGDPILGAHPNSRFTAPASQCPIISEDFDNPKGVPISAIIFGGRRDSVPPLVYEAFDKVEGVYIGATMSSESTSAEAGPTGELKFDPMAMKPFIGYHVGDYFRHWLDMSEMLSKFPKIFHVNWFRKNGPDHDPKEPFTWYGYGHNFRILEWIVKRVDNVAGAVRTPIGFMPQLKHLDLRGYTFTTPEVVEEKLLSLDHSEWPAELDKREKYLKSLEDKVPQELFDVNQRLRERFKQEAEG